MKKHFLYIAMLCLFAPAMMAKVIMIETDEAFNDLVKNKQPMVLKFASNGCGVCRSVAMPFEKISDDAAFKDILFVHINADSVKQASIAYGIVGVPTFICIKNGEKKDQKIGVDNIDNFENEFKNHLQTVFAMSLAQNIDVASAKPMTLDEIAASDNPGMQANKTEKSAEGQTPVAPATGIIPSIKHFFIVVFIKIKAALAWLINKLAFWRK